MGQSRRNRDVGRWAPNSGRGRQWSQADGDGRFYRQPSRRRNNTRQRQRHQQPQRRQRNNPSGIRSGLVPQGSYASSSGQRIIRSTNVQFPKLKAPADTRGVDYEERTLALAFLRCLRYNLRFAISSNNEAAGKFDDLVLRWHYNNGADTYLLLAQLKHRSSTHGFTEVTRAMLLQSSGNNSFSVAMYQDSYYRIKEKMQTPNFTLILSTNAPLAHDTRGMFVQRSPADVPGSEFLDTGGTLYGLNPDNKEMRRAVNSDQRFIEHFAIFCQQKDSEEIKDAIYQEIDKLLVARETGCYIYENLCRAIRDWKLNENMWLSESWKKWTDIVNDYTEKFVCQCGDKSVRPPIVFSSVENIRKFVNSCNPAQITPVRRSTMALTASKIHQALGNETHILLTAKRYQQLRQQVLRVWDRFCKWLVILDDGPEDDNEGFEGLTSHLSSSRRLIFVTNKKDSSFIDTFASLEVTDKCWSKFLEIRISLNGDNYPCCLRDLVGDTGSLKMLLDSRPEDVLTLSQITGTVDIGQRLDPVPEYHISRRVVVRRCVTDDFFSSLGEKDVCIINQDSYVSLPDQAQREVIPDLRRLESLLGSQNTMWPLLTIADDSDRSEIEELCGRHPDVSLYALHFSDDGWEMSYFNGHSDKIQPYIKMQVIQAPEELDIFRGRVILEGAPGTGKSTMLSAVARHMKAIDPAYWIVKVNFSEFYDIFDNCDNSADALEHILMHVTSAEVQMGRLERTLLRNCLQHSSRVICLIDGFDELTSAYTGLSLYILKQLAPNEGGMLVTARHTAKKHLEETLGSLACLLTTFSEDEWQVFLGKYCRTSTGSIDSKTANVAKYLLRLPLFCKMCADLTDHVSVPDAVELYNAFFRRKCEMLWMKKQSANPATDGGKQEFEEQWKRCEEQLIYLAVSSLVQRKDRLGQRPYNPLNKDFFVEAGIMCNSADGRLGFVHRTFAEYFLAKWCFTSIKQQERAVVYREALLDKNLEFFLWTFDRVASKGRRLLELIVDGNENDVMLMLNSRRDVSEVDGAGRNALHLATLYSEPRTVVQRLCARAKPSMLEAEDDLLHWTPLRYAVELGHWPTAAALVKAGAQLKQLADFQAGNHDFNELKNLLPESTFRKFVRHTRYGKGTHSGVKSHTSQSEVKAATFTSVKMAPSNDSQQNFQHWVNIFSVLQRDEWQGTVKHGKCFQAEMASIKKLQPSAQQEKGTNNGAETNVRPSTEKTVTTSHAVRLNVLEPQVHNSKRIDGALQRNQGSNTARPETFSEAQKAPTNNPQPDVRHGQNTDSSLQSDVGQTTAKTTPTVEVETDANNKSHNSPSSRKSCCRCCCCQFSILAAFRVVFCCSSTVPDNGAQHSESTVVHID